MLATVTTLPSPYLIFVGDLTDSRFAKTAFGLRDWAPERCVGELACIDEAVTTGLPRMSPREAVAKGARSLLVGVAPQGGKIEETWIPFFVDALEAGLDIVSGLHVRLTTIPLLVERASALQRQLIDIRVPPEKIPVGTGRKRSGKRLLTVGTDCALGKKYTALSIASAFRDRGISADFRATGQTGIMIAGSGMPMDAVISDFESGAAEMLSPDAAADHWDVIEGQGSLFHPGYAAVSLGLLHGSQPDIFVMCHEPGRTEMAGTAGFDIPDLEEAIDLTMRIGKRTNPSIRCAGFSLNTSKMDVDHAAALCDELSTRFGVPAADPIRRGPHFSRLIDACLG